jgi:hypothetical protein
MTLRTKAFFPYRTGRRKNKCSFLSNEPASPAAAGQQRPPCHFPSRAVPSRIGAGRDTNTNNMYTHCTSCSLAADCMQCSTYCTHAPLQKLACCLSLLNGILPLHRLEQIPRSLRSLHHPPGGTWFHHHPAATCAAASALRAGNALRATFC